MSDEWVRERANRVADIGDRERHNLGFRSRMVDATATAIQEAIERGKAGCAAIDASDPRDLDVIVQGAALTERKRLFARLENPDEALVELLAHEAFIAKAHARLIFPMLARTLTEGKENSE